MPRKKRIEIPGFHHVYNKSIDTMSVLENDDDKEEFIEILQEVAIQYNLTVHSFCITNTNYHLLVENSMPNLSLAMRQLNSIYAMYFNKKYTRQGHVWQDRFKSWYISNLKYLQTIYKYIESNPILEDLAYSIGEYKYSSSFMILNNSILDCAKKSFILNRFTKDELIEYFQTPLTNEENASIYEFRKEKVTIENEKFVKQKVQSLYYIFKDSKSKQERNEKILYAFRKGYKQSEISNYLKLSDSSISKIILKSRNS